jgi:hypothetical protein
MSWLHSFETVLDTLWLAATVLACVCASYSYVLALLCAIWSVPRSLTPVVRRPHGHTLPFPYYDMLTAWAGTFCARFFPTRTLATTRSSLCAHAVAPSAPRAPAPPVTPPFTATRRARKDTEEYTENIAETQQQRGRRGRAGQEADGCLPRRPHRPARRRGSICPTTRS